MLQGLSLPPPPNVSARQRADLLLSVIEDAQLADYAGSDGRTVRAAATQALLALGYPYALEVPPEALEASAREKPLGLLSTRKGLVGFRLVILSGILQLVAPLGIAGMNSWTRHDEALMGALASWGTAITAGTIFLPTLLTLLGHNHGRRALKELGTGWLALVAIFWLVVGILTLPVFPYNLIPLVLGGLVLAGTILMSSSKD
jgi:hypothetical protein